MAVWPNQLPQVDTNGDGVVDAEELAAALNSEDGRLLVDVRMLPCVLCASCVRVGVCFVNDRACVPSA